MKGWITGLSVLGFLFGVASGAVVAFAGAAFGEKEMGGSGAAVFWISFLILIVGFLSWIPRRWFRVFCGLGMLTLAIYGLVANGLFFSLAAIFTLIAGVMMFVFKEGLKVKASPQIT